MDGLGSDSNGFLPHSLLSGGQVSRVDPDSMGLNPAWRNSLVFTLLGAAWEDGANLTEIDAARQVLIQNMKTLEAIAPESGAYFNEVRLPPLSVALRWTHFLPFFLLSIACVL